jgi:hypothetical protein
MRYSIYFTLAASIALFAGCHSFTEQPQSQALCGGIAGIPCAEGYTCIDDPDDNCDPANGGADCGGICVTDDSPIYCGGLIPGPGNSCPEGQECVDDPSDDCTAGIAADCRGICQPEPGCGEDADCEEGEFCDLAAVLCLEGTECGTCKPIEAPQFCGGIANLPCPEGQVCVADPNGCGANGGADCGGVCQPEPSNCDADGNCDDDSCTCDEDCDGDESCQNGVCIDDDSGSPECGGFAGIQCDAGEICIDDPSDECDPENGGADCGGVCIPDPCSAHTDECSCEEDVANQCAVVECPSYEDCHFVCERQ